MKGLLICVCQGTCPSFHNMDVFKILNTIREESLADFVAIHPQLCADDKDNFLYTLLSNNRKIDKLYVAGCDPKMQIKMFSDAFEKAVCDKIRHFGIDIRNMDTEKALNAIKEKVKETES